MNAAPEAARPLSPETWALLACAQAVVDERRLPAFREAVAACTSADRLCSAAVQHGMVGHLHRLISAQPDPSFAAHVAEPLAKLYRTSMQRNLHQAAELLRLLDRAAEAGVDAMPIKGPAWAEDCTATSRCATGSTSIWSCDTNKWPRRARCCWTWGSATTAPTTSDCCVDAPAAWGRFTYARTTATCKWISTGACTSAEPAPTDSAPRLCSRARARRMCWDATFGVRAWTTWLLITAMEGARDRWNRLETCLSLGVQVLDMPAGTWPRVLDAADGIGCRRSLVVGVAHTCRVLAFGVPPEIAAALATDCVAHALLRSVRPRSLEHASGNGQLALTPLWWTFAIEDTWLSAVRHATEHAARPYIGDWEAIALPGASEWLYYLLRPLRLAVKWARRLV